jgi:hypothetical protein
MNAGRGDPVNRLCRDKRLSRRRGPNETLTDFPEIRSRNVNIFAADCGSVETGKPVFVLASAKGDAGYAAG